MKVLLELFTKIFLSVLMWGSLAVTIVVFAVSFEKNISSELFFGVTAATAVIWTIIGNMDSIIESIIDLLPEKTINWMLNKI